MSKEFNYKRAHVQIKQWVDVLLHRGKYYQEIRKCYDLVQQKAEHLQQDGASHDLKGQSQELKDAFDAVPLANLAWVSQVVYYFGHLGGREDYQAMGQYWKFQILADQSLIRRGGTEEMRRAKLRMEKMLKQYHDHQEGTEYDDEEVAELLIRNCDNTITKVLKVDRVNFKPDPFCIGPKHIVNSKGMYLDPTCAPCCTCGEPYDKHTSDRVVFVKCMTQDNEKLQPPLKAMVDYMEKMKIKVDGFVPVKGW